MLVLDMREVGNKLLAIRTRMGMTQVEVAEAAGLSSRTYADILGMEVAFVARVGRDLRRAHPLRGRCCALRYHPL